MLEVKMNETPLGRSVSVTLDLGGLVAGAVAGAAQAFGRELPAEVVTVPVKQIGSRQSAVGSREEENDAAATETSSGLLRRDETAPRNDENAPREKRHYSKKGQPATAAPKAQKTAENKRGYTMHGMAKCAGCGAYDNWHRMPKGKDGKRHCAKCGGN